MNIIKILREHQNAKLIEKTIESSIKLEIGDIISSILSVQMEQSKKYRLI